MAINSLRNIFSPRNLGTAVGILDLLRNRNRGRHPEPEYAAKGFQGDRDGAKERFSLNKFISKINDDSISGLWQPSRFVVKIIPGGNTSKIIRDNVENMTFLCNSAALPGIQIITSDHRRQNMGTFDRRPFGVQATDIPLTFMLDSRGTIQTLFRDWTNQIVNYSFKKGEHKPTRGKHLFEVGYRDEYLCEIDIHCLEQKQKNIITYHLYEAFPMQVGDVTAAWSETDSFGVLPVQFTFRTFDINVEEIGSEDKPSAATTAGDNSTRDSSAPTLGTAKQDTIQTGLSGSSVPIPR
jgi:hypothetical protein